MPVIPPARLVKRLAARLVKRLAARLGKRLAARLGKRQAARLGKRLLQVCSQVKPSAQSSLRS